MAKRTNRVQVLAWKTKDVLPFEILAWKITIVVPPEAILFIDGIVISTMSTLGESAGVLTIPLGGASDDNGCPINTLFSGMYSASSHEGTPIVLFVEYTDPDIG